MSSIGNFTPRFLAYKQTLERMLARLVQPADVEDIIQETWVRVVKAELKTAEELPNSYLYKTARHVALDLLKSDKSDEHQTDVDIDGVLVAAMDRDMGYEVAQSNEQFECFCQAVRDLPSRCRRAFVLKKVYGMSQKEISQYMAISESAVEKLVARGMASCARHLEARGLSVVMSKSTTRSKAVKGDRHEC